MVLGLHLHQVLPLRVTMGVWVLCSVFLPVRRLHLYQGLPLGVRRLLLYQMLPLCMAVLVWVLHLCVLVLVLALVLGEEQCGLLMLRTALLCELASSARRTPSVHGVMPIGVLPYLVCLLLGLQGSMLLSAQRVWCLCVQRMCCAMWPLVLWK